MNSTAPSEPKQLPLFQTSAADGRTVLSLAQVWALAVGGAGESLLATGVSDATVAIWEDVTAADEAAAAEEEEEEVLKQQDLSNALQVCTALQQSILNMSLRAAQTHCLPCGAGTSKGFLPHYGPASPKDVCVTCLQRKDYSAAAALAFEMRQPRRLLSVVEAAISGGGGGGGRSTGGTAILEVAPNTTQGSCA